jgi:hypothetical protein
MNTHLRHDHEELLESLVGGKLPRNLTWTAVVDLIEKIGQVEPHGNDDFAFQVGSQREFFKRPSGHDMEEEDVSRLRRFLKESGVQGKSARAHRAGRVVVVIDHHSAHIYQDLGGSRPEDEMTVKPYDPFGFEHHLVHRKEDNFKGNRVPEEDSYYEEINAADFLSAYLKTHDPETFERIVAIETADLSALTEPEIEQIAKKHMLAPVAVAD